MTPRALLTPVRALAARAGAEILRLRPEAAVRTKADASPVTDADEAAERLIVAGLAELTPTLPVVAEELVAAGQVPSIDGAFWLVDPLDGTKAFVRGDSDFTVNIALIQERRPVLGVVYAPALDDLFGGVAGEGATRSKGGGPARAIHCRAAPPDGLDVLASQMHDQAEAIEALTKGWKVRAIRRLSSSLKFCLLAAGEADLYVRRGETSEWDTAAGHAVLCAAGGIVTTLNGADLMYAKPGFRNPGFIAACRAS